MQFTLLRTLVDLSNCFHLNLLKCLLQDYEWLSQTTLCTFLSKSKVEPRNEQELIRCLRNA